MKAPQRAARKATVMVTIDAPWTSFIVVSTSLPPGSPMSRGVGSARAMARVIKKNGSTTRSTSSSGRCVCSRNPSRVAVWAVRTISAPRLPQIPSGARIGVARRDPHIPPARERLPDDGAQAAVGADGEDHATTSSRIGADAGVPVAPPSRWARKRRSRSALATTETLENPMAAPATSGLSKPRAARGRAAML
jgi:hypothetical protein